MKPARLVLVTGDECLHSISTNSNRVCLKEKKKGTNNCGMKHQGGHLEIQEATLLVHANSNMAYSTPSLTVSKLVGSENEMNDLLSITELNPSEWSAKFEVYNQLWESISGLEMAHRLGYLDRPSPTSTPWKKDRGRVHEEAIINQPAYIYIPKVNNESYSAMEEEAGVVTADIINHVDEGIVNLRHDL